MDERRRVSRQQEKAVARRMGARQHKGSGSGATPNDLHDAHYLVECKTTTRGKKSITLQAVDLTELAKRAALQGRIAVMHVRLAGKNWVVISEDDFSELDPVAILGATDV